MLFHPTNFCASMICTILMFTSIRLPEYLEPRIVSGLCIFVVLICGLVALSNSLLRMTGKCRCDRSLQNRILMRSSSSLIKRVLVAGMVTLPTLVMSLQVSQSDYSFFGLCLTFPYLLFILYNPHHSYEAEIRLATKPDLNINDLQDKTPRELVAIKQLASDLLEYKNERLIEREINRQRATRG